LNSRGVVAIPRGDRGITDEAVARALDAAQAISIPENYEILHVIPRGFSIDGQEGVSDPRGMNGVRLEVEAHIIVGATPTIQNLIKCIHSLDIQVDELVLASLASGEATLTDTERAMGVVVADIGGGTTDIAIFIEGSVWHTSVLPVGGHHLTNDVAICLRTPFEEAEEIKKKNGHACPDQVHEDEMLDIAAFGEDTHQTIPRQELARVLHARVEEIASLILQEIKRSGYDGLLPAGVVLCGGTSRLPGIRDVAHKVIGLPVRIGRPHDLQGLVDTLTGPAYATSVGLLQWGQRQKPIVRLQSSRTSLPSRMTRWFRNLLPG
jgi:cell division protein FtsA